MTDCDHAVIEKRHDVHHPEMSAAKNPQKSYQHRTLGGKEQIPSEP